MKHIRAAAFIILAFGTNTAQAQQASIEKTKWFKEIIDTINRNTASTDKNTKSIDRIESTINKFYADSTTYNRVIYVSKYSYIANVIDSCTNQAKYYFRVSRLYDSNPSGAHNSSYHMTDMTPGCPGRTWTKKADIPEFTRKDNQTPMNNTQMFNLYKKRIAENKNAFLHFGDDIVFVGNATNAGPGQCKGRILHSGQIVLMTRFDVWPEGAVTETASVRDLAGAVDNIQIDASAGPIKAKDFFGFDRGYFDVLCLAEAAP